MIDAEPRPSSWGTKAAFVHPKGSFGTLIEFVRTDPWVRERTRAPAVASA